MNDKTLAQIAAELPKLPPLKLHSAGHKLEHNLGSMEERAVAADPCTWLSVPEFASGLGSFLDVPVGRDTASSAMEWRGSSDDPFQSGSAVHRSGKGARIGRPSVSQGIVGNGLELLSGFATAEAGPSDFGSDISDEDWNSDSYENDDDPGYHRQPIVDEEWFLTHEVDYPSEDEQATPSLGSQALPESENERDDLENPSFVEDDSYFSGEEYYLNKSDKLEAVESLKPGSPDDLVDTTVQQADAQSGEVHVAVPDSDFYDFRSSAVEPPVSGSLAKGSYGVQFWGERRGDVVRDDGGPSSNGGDGFLDFDAGGSRAGGFALWKSRSSQAQAVDEQGRLVGPPLDGGESVPSVCVEPCVHEWCMTERARLVADPSVKVKHQQEVGEASGFEGFSFSPPCGPGETTVMLNADLKSSPWAVKDLTTVTTQSTSFGDGIIAPDRTLASWRRLSTESGPLAASTTEALLSLSTVGQAHMDDARDVSGGEQGQGQETGPWHATAQGSGHGPGEDRLGPGPAAGTGARQELGEVQRHEEEQGRGHGEVPGLEKDGQGPLRLWSGQGQVQKEEERQEQDQRQRKSLGQGREQGLTDRLEQGAEQDPENRRQDDPGKELELDLALSLTLRQGQSDAQLLVDKKQEEQEKLRTEKLEHEDGDLHQISRAPRAGTLFQKHPQLEEEEFETFHLKIVHRKNKTGFEEDKEFPVVINSVIAGRYQVTEYLGAAAFSRAIQAHDLQTGMDVCMKIIKNNKDFFDQSLDEIKLLKFINKNDPADKYHVLRLYDYFYHREHLFIVCELLRANLYEFHKYNRESGGEVYFTMHRLQSITRQCLEALEFIHGLGLIHCDLKPENILVKSYSRCEVKVIDLGSSCFQTDHLCSYVQSRSYRAPEVIIGLPYDQKIDIWSLGCILAELCSGNVLFQNDSIATLLARVVGILGPFDPDMLARGHDTHKYFTRNHTLYERNPDTDQLEYLLPKKTSLAHRLRMGDQGFVNFVGFLLQINPEKRPSSSEALKHPWLSHPYETNSS